jgi:hypothetical protein
MRSKMPLPNEVSLDTPLRLSVAAALAFPDGSMTPSGLRREIVRGRLVIERIAGKDYTTLANIERMRELCRVENNHRAYISEKGADGTPIGSYWTAAARSAQARAKQISAQLKKR